MEPGCTIPAHEAMCEVVGVADWFGEVGQGEAIRVLAPGRYKLMAGFRVHLLDREKSRDYLTSNSVEFDVNPPSRSTVSEQNGLRLLNETYRKRSRDRAPEFIRRAGAVSLPGYRAGITRLLLPWMTKEDAAAAAAAIESEGSRYGSMWVLRAELPQVARRYDEGMAWIAAMRITFTSTEQRCVFNWWEQVIEQSRGRTRE
jgi:hypothetical protein